MLTTRKGNKRFAFYDLKLTLAWEARPAGAAAEAGEAPAGAAGAAGGEGAGTAADADGAEEGGSGPPLISGELAVAEFGSVSGWPMASLAVGTCSPE